MFFFSFFYCISFCYVFLGIFLLCFLLCEIIYCFIYCIVYQYTLIRDYSWSWNSGSALLCWFPEQCSRLMIDLIYLTIFLLGLLYSRKVKSSRLNESFIISNNARLSYSFDVKVVSIITYLILHGLPFWLCNSFMYVCMYVCM